MGRCLHLCSNGLSSRLALSFNLVHNSFSMHNFFGCILPYSALLSAIRLFCSWGNQNFCISCSNLLHKDFLLGLCGLAFSFCSGLALGFVFTLNSKFFR